jgi:DNA-binding transcriptional ArsR family regulator
MSKEARDRVLELPRKPGLPQLCVLLVLAEKADAQGVLWHKIKSIAELLGSSVRTVQDHLNTLESHGLIYSQAQGGQGKGGFLVTCGLSEEEIALILERHPRFGFGHLEAQREAEGIASRVQNPAPLNRQSRVKNPAHEDAESRTLRVQNPAFKGAESRVSYKDEPKRTESEPKVKDAHTSESHPVRPADLVAFETITNRLHGTMSNLLNMRFMENLNRLRLKTEPPATPENILLFGKLWKEMGRSVPQDHQVPTHWEDVHNPPVKRGKGQPKNQAEADFMAQREAHKARRFGQRTASQT